MPRRRGEVTLVDEQGTALGHFAPDPRAPAFGRKVPVVVVDVVDSSHRADEWSVSTGDGTAPDGAVGMILHAVDGRRRTAIDWRLGEGSERPPLQPPGIRNPRVGERVEIRWFDLTGRLSVATKIVTVGTAIGGVTP